MKKYKKVTITWEDITFFSNTIPIENLDKLSVVEVETTGYLIEKNKEYITLACSVSYNKDELMDVYKFPAPVVKKITYLKER